MDVGSSYEFCHKMSNNEYLEWQPTGLHVIGPWAVQASKLVIDTKDLIFGHFDRDDRPTISLKK